MERSTSTNVNYEDEVSVKDLIVKMLQWKTYFFQQWKVILLFGLLGAAIGLTYSFFQDRKYEATLSFVLEDSKSNSLGQYAGLASQFGLDLGGSSGSGVFTGDNIMEFLKSRLMVEKTLLSPVNIDGHEISMAKMYIDMNDMSKGWEKTPLKGLQFPVNPDRSKFNRLQDSVLNSIQQDLVKNNLTVAKPDKKSSFIAVKCIAKNELFAKYFTERLVKEATDFYVETKIKRFKTNVDKLELKADSLETLLNRKTYSVAASQDLNMNPARSVANVGTELATRDKMVLQTMYGEIVKNLEMSRMSMAQETPLIQIIDTPILPLKAVKFGKVKGVILGGIAGGFLILLVLVIRRTYKMVMS